MAQIMDKRSPHCAGWNHSAPAVIVQDVTPFEAHNPNTFIHSQDICSTLASHEKGACKWTKWTHQVFDSLSSIGQKKKKHFLVPLSSLQVVNGCKMKLRYAWLMWRLTPPHPLPTPPPLSHRKWMRISSHALKMRTWKCNFRTHFLQFELLLNGLLALCSRIVSHGQVGYSDVFVYLACTCVCIFHFILFSSQHFKSRPVPVA